MEPNPAASINKHFSNLEDPRVERTKLHALLDILVIAICAAICGAANWAEVELFGNAKQPGLRRFWNCPTASLRMTSSGGSLPAWTPSSSSNASWTGSLPLAA